MNEHVEKMMELIENKLKSLVAKIDTYNSASSSVNSTTTRVMEMANELEKNPFLLSDYDFHFQLEKYLVEIEDDELSKNIFNDVIILKYITDASKMGIDISLNEDELARVSRIKDALGVVEKQYRHRNDENKIKVTATNKLFEEYSGAYDKMIIGEKGKEYLTDHEIDLLLDICSEEDFDFKFSILEHIRRISSGVSKNRESSIGAVDDYNEEDEINETEIDDDIFRGLFTKYGYDYDAMPVEYQEYLRKRGKVQKIVDLFNYLDSTPEYSFFKVYGKDSGNATENRSQFKRFCLLLCNASIDTLDYMLADSKNRDVDLRDYFKVKGIYKHVTHHISSFIERSTSESDSLALSGAFEYYRKTSEILDELSAKYRIKFNDPSIDLFKSTMTRNADLFSKNPELLQKNLKIAEEYDFDLVYKKNGMYRIAAASFLLSGDMRRFVDLFLENKPLYDYILKYPSILKQECLVNSAVARRNNNTLEFDNGGRLKDRYRIEYASYEHMRGLSDDIPSKLIAASHLNNNIEHEQYREDDITHQLEEVVNRQEQNGLCYELNGVPVSRYKFLRVWTSMMNEYDTMNPIEKSECDMKKNVLYALTYNSCYKPSELDSIKTFVNQMNFDSGRGAK